MRRPDFSLTLATLALTETERWAIVLWVAANPMAGDVMEGTGGARKLRFSGKGKGKSGGYRVITFYSGTGVPVFLLNVFAKNERANLTPKERVTLKAILGETVRTYRKRRELR